MQHDLLTSCCLRCASVVLGKEDGSDSSKSGWLHGVPKSTTDREVMQFNECSVMI